MTQGRSSGSNGLAEQRLGDAGAEFLGDRDHLICRMQRAGTDQHRHLAASVQHIGGRRSSVSSGSRFAASAQPMPECTVPCCARRHLDRGSSCRSFGRMIAVTLRSAYAMRMARSIEMADLRRCRCLLDERAGDILEQARRSISCW